MELVTNKKYQTIFYTRLIESTDPNVDEETRYRKFISSI